MLHEGVGEFGGLGFVVSGDGEFVWKGVTTLACTMRDFELIGSLAYQRFESSNLVIRGRTILEIHTFLL